MKTSVKLFLFGALALTAMACTHINLEYRHGSPTFTGGVAETTRAEGNLWYGDKVGIMTVDATRSQMVSDYANVGYQTDASGVTTATFTVINEADDIIFENSEETVTFVAYAPYYESAITELPGQNKDGVITGNTETQTTYDSQVALDNLYAGAKTGSESVPEVHFNFYHKMTQLIVKITAGDGLDASDIQAGTYTLGGIIQDGEFNLDQTSSAVGTCYTTGTTPLDDWDLQSKWYVTTGGDDYDVCFTCIIYPQTPTTLPFYAHVDQADFTGTDFYDYLDDGEFKEGCSYTYNITVNEHDLTVTGSTITDWNYYNYDIILGGGSSDDQSTETETVVYSNDFDATVVSSNTNFSESVTAYKNETGTGISTVSYGWSSNLSIRTSSPSDNSSSKYDGSGNNNIFFGNSSLEYFYINDITLPDGETDYTLSFGGYESGKTYEHDYFKVYVSEDGEKWVKLDFTFANGDASSSWGLASVTFTVPSGTSTLSIYFESDEASVFRIDDVSLVVSETAGTEIDFSAGVSVPEESDDSGNNPDDVETTGDGSSSNPYTVADAYALVEADAIPTGNVYVTGTVCSIGSLNSSYGELTYYISDDGTTTNDFEVYSGYGLNGEQITSADYLSVGDVVVVCGQMQSYNGAPEFNYGSTILSINGSSEGSGSTGGDDSGSTGEQDEKYVANVTWSGDSSTHCEPSDYISIDGVSYDNVLKIGTTNAVGSGTCTLPVGANSFSFYCLGWKSTPCKVTVGETTYEFTADGSPAVSGNSPYSVSASDLDDSDFGSFTFDALTEETTLTFETTGSNYRVVVFGAKYGTAN
ncbi:MAG: fimbrillin family protein [Bacteroidales bacterium]|nr:fimbrillin family protein [Bacteroidales bacterium]